MDSHDYIQRPKRLLLVGKIKDWPYFAIQQKMPYVSGNPDYGQPAGIQFGRRQTDTPAQRLLTRAKTLGSSFTEDDCGRASAGILALKPAPLQDRNRHGPEIVFACNPYLRQ